MKHSVLKILFLPLFLFLSLIGSAQTFGPNSPSTGSNNASVGAFAWTTPSNVLSSNNAYATNTNKGLTNYISASNFGFTIPATTIINGIQLDIERSTLSPTVVSVLNNWTAGLTKTVSAGSSRMMLFVASMENGNGARDITTLRYGGQAMTQIVEGSVVSASGFAAKLEFWVLLESGIASATSTAFTATFASATLVENVEYYASAVYAGVDQILPYTTTAIFTSTSSTNPFTASPTLATTGGGMAVSAVHIGNPPGGAYSVGSTNLAFTTGGGFTEVIDTYTAASGFTTSGICTGIGHQSITASGTVAPTYTFSGTVNRAIAVYCNLTCINELDNSVRLVKGGTITGNNLANTTSPWNTVDTYASYGGASNLWGSTWVNTDFNATNFGAVISATVSNGTARVDHMRVTVYATSTVPIELLDFMANGRDDKVVLRWRTASEKNSKLFEIERRTGLEDFVKIGCINGRGNSTALNEYSFIDKNHPPCLCYYRLKQVDLDGSYRYSPVVLTDVNLDDSQPLIFPNPSCGLFNINLNDLGGNNILIYTQDMKLVKTLTLDSNEWDFSLQELADGSYYVIVNTSSGQKIKRIEKICR